MGTCMKAAKGGAPRRLLKVCPILLPADELRYKNYTALRPRIFRLVWY